MASHSVWWKLVSLNQVQVECVEYTNKVGFCCIAEIWPVETICHVNLVDCGTEVSFFPGFILVTQINLDGVQV